MKTHYLLLALLISAPCVPNASWAADSQKAKKATNAPVSQLAWRDALLEGRKQEALQHLDVAESCFKQALNEAKRTHAAPLDLVTCYRSLAEVQVKEDIVEDAYPNYRRALTILKKDEHENFALLAETYGNMGDIAYADGDFLKARQLFASALKVLADAEQHDSYLYTSLEHRYGKTAYKLGDHRSAADAYYDATARLMRQADMPNQNLLIDVLADYIDLFRNTQDQGLVRQSSVQNELLKDSPDLFANGKGVAPSNFSTEISARLADRVVADSSHKDSAASSNVSSSFTTSSSHTTAPGVNLPGTASDTTVLNSNSFAASNTLPNSTIIPDHKLHDVALDQQVEQQRIDFYERMVSVDIKALGPNHPSVARDLTSLATVYLAANNFEEAKPLLQRALVIYEQTYGAKAALTERTRMLVHVISAEQRARDAGEPPANEYVGKLVKIPIAAQTPEVALRLNYLALQCLSYGKLSEAYTLYSWALAATARVSGDRGMLTACCLNDYARVLRACNQDSVASQYETDAAAIVRANIVKKAAAKSI